MKKNDILPLLASLGVNPSRKLGQNFLVDDNCLNAMVRMAAPRRGETILEIGPGTGVLTERLLEAGTTLVAVELDHRLVEYLQRKFAGNPDFQLISGDACRLQYETLEALKGEYRCIANLPYSCGSVFLAKICTCPVPPRELFVLLQREMAERLAASPNEGDYGALTVRLALRYDVTILKTIPPDVFYPAPDVSSSFVRLTRLDTADVDANLLEMADELAVRAFSQRRKKAMKLLAPAFGTTSVPSAFAQMGLDENARAENISPEQYLELAKRITKH